jgi:4-amino-4-deoxy-L-arabinose transferase-like glycosyltransferase
LNRSAPLRTFAAGLLVGATLYFCFFSGLGAMGLVGPDEPRYAWVARAMAQSRDWFGWITPSLYGQPWFEKPVLYYWAAGAAFRAFGVSEFAARLPSALAALLAAFTIAWAARQLYGLRTAWAVLLIFPTCVGVFGFARAATTDMIFASCLAVAMVLAAFIVLGQTGGTGMGARHRTGKAVHLLALARFGGWLGLATLAKGPAAIVLAGGSVGLWALATRRWRPALRLLHPLAFGAFGVVALPWYVLCAYLNPGFAIDFLLRHNFERYLTPVFQHVQALWYFAPILLLGLAPWTALLAGAARDGIILFRQADWKDSPGLFFACWVIFPLAFFSLSQSKLPGYVLPVFPPLALLLAHSLVRSMEQKDRLARWLPAAVGATWVALALSAGYWLKRLPAEFVATNFYRIIYCICLTVAVGSLIAILGLTNRGWGALALSAALMAALVVQVNRQFLPQLDPYLSARRAARFFPLALRNETSDVAVEGPVTYGLDRSFQYGLGFYLEQSLPVWTPSAVRRSAPIPLGQRYVYTSTQGLAQLEKLGWTFKAIGQASDQAVFVRAFVPASGCCSRGSAEGSRAPALREGKHPALRSQR